MARQKPRSYVSPRETLAFLRFELRASHLKTKIPDGADMRGTHISASPILKPDTARSASLTVCEHADSVADAHALLGTLGLTPPP